MPREAVFVVPLDFSPDTEATLSAAFELAKQRGAQVHLLEVTPNRGPSRLDEGADLRVSDRARSKQDWSRLEPSIEAAQERGIRVRAIAYRGDATTIIASHVQLTNARLLIIGQHHGTMRWRRSTRIVSNVSRSAPVPVLVLPPHPGASTQQLFPFRHVVSAVDLTVASAVALRTVLDLIRGTRARLTLVHALKNAPNQMVFSGGEAAKAIRHLREEAAAVAERLKRKIPDDVDLRVDARVDTGPPDRVILAVAAAVNADLIVMGVPLRARMDEVLFGSTLQRVLRRTKIPLLILPVLAGEHKWLQETDGVELSLAATTPKQSKRLRASRR
jgi:nucleotide-binding universal stress UspA family protein